MVFDHERDGPSRWAAAVSIAKKIGWDGLIVDALLQILMIALRSSLVPTLLTRERVMAGAIAPLPSHGHWPHHALICSLTIALSVAVLAVVAHPAGVPPVGATVPFAAVLAFKPVCGALLGAAVSRLAVTAALGDRHLSVGTIADVATDRPDTPVR